MLDVAAIASRAASPFLRGGVGWASQDIQHERLRPRRRCLLAALPRLQGARAQSVYQSGRRRLRHPLPAAYGFQLFGKSHGFSIRETRIAINQETAVSQRDAIPPPNLQYRGSAKTVKIVSRDLFRCVLTRVCTCGIRQNQHFSKPSMIKYGMMKFSLHHRVAAPPGADVTCKRGRAADEKGKR